MRHYAKFCGDRSNRCPDVTIYDFFQYDGCAPSCICCTCIWTASKECDGSLHCCAKFGWNRCSSFDNMQVLIF